VFGEVRHAGGPPPGMCMHHIFKEDECTNGLPRGNCFASFARMIECGDEQVMYSWLCVCEHMEHRVYLFGGGGGWCSGVLVFWHVECID
jgi:hypothetical protein